MKTWIIFPFVLLIRMYQWIVRPFLGSRCRFHPSCSEYSLEALRRRGLIGGLRLSMLRIGRCHPWHPGGYDPVP